MKIGYVMFLLTVAVAVLGLPAPAFSNFIYDEDVNGDLSNERLAPTPLLAGPGANTVTGRSSRSPVTGIVDLDYFTVTIPTGFQLDSLFETDYRGDGISFIAIQSGTTFTSPPDNPDITTFLGWLHFGDLYLGQDILPIMAEAFDVIGYTLPLPSGSYTFWVQETNPLIEAKYILTFNVSEVLVVPEPSSLSLAGLGALCGLGYARWWRRRISARLSH